MLKLGTKGRTAEDKALKYLKQQGLKLVERNYTCRYGEIDLIMLNQETIVFVEVRYRASNDYGGALQSITAAKQAKLRKTAQHFLSAPRMNRKGHNIACRFDIICMRGSLHNPEVDWLVNAF